MSTRVDDFIATPTVETFNLLKKDELVSVATHYKVSVKSSQLKRDIKNTLLNFFVENEIFEETALQFLVENSSEAVRA